MKRAKDFEAIPGIGPITASAIVATVGNATEYKNGRQLGGMVRIGAQSNVPAVVSRLLLGISKRGDTYLRTLLIHGARAVIRYAENKAGPESWLRKLITRRNKNIAAVALANKNARIIWALLTKGTTFHPDHASAAYAAAA